MPPLDLPDPPELLLRRTLATMLHNEGLGLYRPGGPDFAKTEHGILTKGDLPTTFDDCTVISSQQTTPDGRADALYRVQFLTRIKAANEEQTERWASALGRLLDQKSYTPLVLGISWAWETSRLPFGADGNRRHTVAVNYAFRGRRVAE